MNERATLKPVRIPATGERLPVVVDGRLQPDDVLILTEIEIE
jgi:hypothetical protein